jgi:hypothetical protein
LNNVLFDLSGRVHVRGRGPATPSRLRAFWSVARRRMTY